VEPADAPKRRCQSAEGPLLHGEVRFEVAVRGGGAFVPEPEGDHREVDPRLQQVHGCGVAERVRGMRRPRSVGHPLAAARTARRSRVSTPDRVREVPRRLGKSGACGRSSIRGSHARRCVAVVFQRGTVLSFRPLPWRCTVGVAPRCTSPTVMAIASETRAPVL